MARGGAENNPEFGEGDPGYLELTDGQHLLLYCSLNYSSSDIIHLPYFRDTIIQFCSYTLICIIF